MEGALQIAIVDDHPVFRNGLKSLLVTTGTAEVREFSAIGDFLACEEEQPDLVMLDVCMPEGSGLDLLRQKPPKDHGYRVILLSSDLREHEVHEAISLGVGAVLRKDADIEEIMDAIEHVRQGETYYPAYVAQMLNRLTGCTLTPREREVLKLLSVGALNKEIADQLDISVNTVKDVLRNLYRKLGVQTRVEAVKEAASRGLIRMGTV